MIYRTTPPPAHPAGRQLLDWALAEAARWPGTPQFYYTWWLRYAERRKERRMEQLDLFADVRRVGEYAIPEGAIPTTCRSCGASIVWARTEGEKAIPLALATARDCGGVRVALTHFADCTDSRAWRRKE
jgi:hypothetical protein